MIQTDVLPAPIPTPSWSLLGVEPIRAWLEYASMSWMDTASLPRGDGHPVVIFPGLATDRHSTGPLRVFCRSLGYAAYDWGRGLNTGPDARIDAWFDDLARHVEELTAAHPERVSLVGWSLGGIYAREVAKKLPARVRQVITIGTPFARTAEQTHMAWMLRLFNVHPPAFDEALLSRLRTPPDVPTTSIFSRSDGIVAWQTCLQGGGGAHTDHIEVDGSHVGMGWNPQVLSIIAHKLGTAP